MDTEIQVSEHDFDDDISDLIGAPMKAISAKAAAYVAKDFSEDCPACGGTGRWRRIRPCFKCKSTGRLTFKTSPEQRAQSRVYVEKRKVRNAQENWEGFVKDHPEVAEWLDRSVNFPFAQSLKKGVLQYGQLTEPQLAAAYSCAAKYTKAVAHNKEAKANAKTVSTSKLEEAFAKASAKADRPGARGVWMKPLHLQSDSKVDLKFTLGTNKWAGMIFVKADENKLGHIQNGKFIRKFQCTDDQEAAVLDCCNDPLKAAIAYGKAWSSCAVCNRTLTNDESIERGIGPICAAKFGW